MSKNEIFSDTYKKTIKKIENLKNLNEISGLNLMYVAITKNKAVSHYRDLNEKETKQITKEILSARNFIKNSHRSYIKNEIIYANKYELKEESQKSKESLSSKKTINADLESLENIIDSINFGEGEYSYINKEKRRDVAQSIEKCLHLMEKLKKHDQKNEIPEKNLIKNKSKFLLETLKDIANATEEIIFLLDLGKLEYQEIEEFINEQIFSYQEINKIIKLIN